MRKPIVLVMMALPLVITSASIRAFGIARFPDTPDVLAVASQATLHPSVLLLATRDQQTQECRWLGTCFRR